MKLEQTAMTLYRHTFVEGIDQDNPPEGWEVGHISDLGEIVSGATPSTEHPEYWTNDGIHWLSPADLSKQNKKFISRGDRDITELDINQPVECYQPDQYSFLLELQ